LVALLPSEREELFMFTTVPVAERRPTRRLSLHVPLRVRVWQSAVPEQKVEYFNISERGVYFAGGTRFREGEQLELIPRMPEEIAGQARTNWRCLGRVVRTSALDSSSWARGVAARFEHYQEVEGFPRYFDGKRW
jgi:hypothetical protein